MSTLLPYNFDNLSAYASHPNPRPTRRFPTTGPMGQPDNHAESSTVSEQSNVMPSSPTSRTACFLAPTHTPHRALTVAEWAGAKRIPHPDTLPNAIWAYNAEQDADNDASWRDVNRNIKRMDQLYDATFYSWLKSEDNVLVTAMYLHRIANEYALERIANALKWLVSDWRWESTSILVRHVTGDWRDKDGDLNRAYLLRHLTQNWATQYTAALITTILATPPYVSADNIQRERFLRAFTQDWDFSKLSEFFMYLQSRANIDYKLKCVMLQEAARREREALSAKLNHRKKRTASKVELAAQPLRNDDSEMQMATDGEDPISDVNAMDTSSDHAGNLASHSAVRTCSNTHPGTDEPSPAAVTDTAPMAGTSDGSNSSGWRQHHRRTSSNDVADMNKRFRLSRPELAVEGSEAVATSSASVGCISSTVSPGPSPSSSAVTTALGHSSGSSSTTSSRRAATPDHAYHHHYLRCPSSAATSSSSCSISATTSASHGCEGSTNGGSELSHRHSGRPRTTGSATTSSGVTAPLTITPTSTSTSSASSPAPTTTATTTTTTTPIATTPSPNALAPQSTSANPPVVDAFPGPRHTCYQANTTTVSHLHVHGFHLRRRSSSSSSTGSTGSTGSGSSYRDPTTTEDDVSSGVKKRTSAMSTSGRTQRRVADE